MLSAASNSRWTDVCRSLSLSERRGAANNSASSRGLSDAGDGLRRPWLQRRPRRLAPGAVRGRTGDRHQPGRPAGLRAVAAAVDRGANLHEAWPQPSPEQGRCFSSCEIIRIPPLFRARRIVLTASITLVGVSGSIIRPNRRVVKPARRITRMLTRESRARPDLPARDQNSLAVADRRHAGQLPSSPMDAARPERLTLTQIIRTASEQPRAWLLSAISLCLLGPQQRVVRLCSEEPRQECLLVVGQCRVPLTLGLDLQLQ
jgi:hypothetical protein